MHRASQRTPTDLKRTSCGSGMFVPRLSCEKPHEGGGCIVPPFRPSPSQGKCEDASCPDFRSHYPIP